MVFKQLFFIFFKVCCSIYLHYFCCVSNGEKILNQRFNKLWFCHIPFSSLLHWPGFFKKKIARVFFCFFWHRHKCCERTKNWVSCCKWTRNILSRMFGGSFTRVYTRGPWAVEYLAKLSWILKIFSKPFKAMILGFNFI